MPVGDWWVTEEVRPGGYVVAEAAGPAGDRAHFPLVPYNGRNLTPEQPAELDGKKLHHGRHRWARTWARLEPL